MDYYQKNASEYINKTKDVDMSEAYQFFLKYAKTKGKLLDIGFGSGRDMLYFKSIGFDVEGIDPQPEFCDEAKKIGLNVACCAIDDCYKESDKYDYLWACASMHHIPKEMLNQDFKICSNILKKNGIMFCSFKYGEFEGYDESLRYFNYLTEKTIDEYLIDTNFKMLDHKITDDNLNRDTKWISFILKNKGDDLNNG